MYHHDFSKQQIITFYDKFNMIFHHQIKHTIDQFIQLVTFVINLL